MLIIIVEWIVVVHIIVVGVWHHVCGWRQW